jgi:hypothetical protein
LEYGYKEKKDEGRGEDFLQKVLPTPLSKTLRERLLFENENEKTRSARLGM